MIRQGDILLIPVKEVRGGELGEPCQRGEVTLAHGEATGHRHRIPRGAALYELPGTEPSERIARARKLLRTLPSIDELAADAVPIGVVRVQGRQELVHEEHGAIDLTGDYLALRQREYSPEAIRTVAD